jgi:hypothetical protein
MTTTITDLDDFKAPDPFFASHQGLPADEQVPKMFPQPPAKRLLRWRRRRV